jgi:hypothetical protein
MSGPIYTHLNPVRRRQQWAFVLSLMALGLLASSMAGIALGLGRWLLGWPILPEVAVAVLAAGPVLGLLIGLAWRRNWHGAAVAVDSHYRLKDRVATALAFLTRPERTAVHELQLHDAEQHLSKVEPRQVMPVKAPRMLPFALLTSAAAVALFLLPGMLTPPSEAAAAEPLAAAVAEAERIAEDAKEFEELAKKDQNKDLEQLAKEMKRVAEELQQPGIDLREALAKLSELQATVQATQAQFNVGLVDAQLQSLGEAMSAAHTLEGAGKALVEGKYEKAAKELEHLDDPELDRKEAKTVEEKLKKAAKEAGEVGLGSLSECASEMAEGIKGGGKAKFKKATKELAAMVSKHGRLKKINEILNGELARLNEGKCNCQANSTAKGKFPNKSLSPSQSWGMGTSGNVIGEKTNMLSQRQLEQITGNPGEGPAEVETEHSAEGRQQAARGYREVYKKYQRESEAVLDSEPIPIGHRQTIRKYFELIRPQKGESEERPPADKPSMPRKSTGE